MPAKHTATETPDRRHVGVEAVEAVSEENSVAVVPTAAAAATVSCATAGSMAATTAANSTTATTMTTLHGPVRRRPDFYLDTLYKWVQNSEVATSHGMAMMHQLHMDLDCAIKNEPPESEDYLEALQETYKTVADGMMSAVHRRVPFYHVNRSMGHGLHITTDEEEMEIRGMMEDPMEGDGMDEDEEEEEEELDGKASRKPLGVAGSDHGGAAGGSKVGSVGTGCGSGIGSAAASPAVDPKLKKREEARKRRAEEEQMLVRDKQVRDDKGNVLATIGPHPAPRLHYRAAKAGSSFPSRKSLSQRLNTDALNTEDAEDDHFVPSTKGPSPGVDAVDHLTAYIRPLSQDSLKKISESAKVKIVNNIQHAEAVDQIVKAAVRIGCEKACMLMDKFKIIDAVTDHAHAKHTSVSTMGPIGASVEFLKSLPDELKEALGPVLGMPKDKNSVPEMWERIVAMGFLKVLANLRQRPLRKIVQELNLDVQESMSTEKTCEVIVFCAFPEEMQRMRNARLRQQGVIFSVVQSRSRVLGDMGFITFNIQNISSMQRDAERHYSPEFEFGGLKWSLLCMANKENLALYLCQTGSVHCKFIISVLNNKAPDESICNEGTQKFSSSSAENDWGFNNVVKFDALLDPNNNFWNSENDSISIEVGIVFVDFIPQKALHHAGAAGGKIGAGGKHDPNAAVGGGDGGVVKEIANNGGVNDPMRGVPNGHGRAAKAGAVGGGAALENKAVKQRAQLEKEEQTRRERQQLLETERVEALRKKLKTEMNKVQKDEDRLRKELHSKAAKALHQLQDMCIAERQRMQREQRERERREQAEKQREQDRIRQAIEQNNGMRAQIDELSAESAQLDEKVTAAMEAVDSQKVQQEALREELLQIEGEISAAHSRVKKQQKMLALRRKELEQARQELRESPKPSEAEDVLLPGNVDETELMKALRLSLAGILTQDS